MQTVYIGNTLINDVMLGSQRMDDVLQASYPLSVEYLIVAGGGNAGWYGAGGGGAGGLLSGSLTLLPQTLYTGSVADSAQNSWFTNLTAIKGGIGGSPLFGNGGSGGSGGGGARSNTTGGTGTVGQGNNGGNGFAGSAGGGGGGAATVGSTASSGVGGNGGNGKQSAIDGTLKYYAGGGGGAGATNGSGGLGGGGNAGATAGSNGSPNTGGGAGGTNSDNGYSASGGSGIIVLRYKGNQRAIGGDSIYSDGNYMVHKFTTSGSFEFQTF